MAASGRRILRNLVVSGAGQGVAAAVNLAVTVLLARYLGVQRYGVYATVQALVATFQLLASVGLENILVRDVAVRPSDAPRLVGAARALTWVLSLATFGAIAGVAALTAASPEVRLATCIAGAGVLATIHAVTLAAVFRAFEEMEVNAVGLVLHRLLFLGLVGAAAWVDAGLVGVCTAFAASNAWLWLYYLVALSRRHFRPRLRVAPRLWWSLLRESTPLGLANLFRRASWQVDVLVLGALGHPEAAGQFSAGYRFVQALNLVPLTVAQVCFPPLARWASRPERFREFLGLVLRGLVVVAVPLTALLGAGAGPAIRIVYGAAYEPAASVLAVLGLTLPLLFASTLYGVVFTALGDQRRYAWVVATCLAVNVVLDLVLVPALREVGAALATLGAEAALFVVGWHALRGRGHVPSPLALAGRPLAAGLLMALPLVLARGAPPAGLALGGLGAVALYGAALVGLGVLGRGDIVRLRALLRRDRGPAPPSQG